MRARRVTHSAEVTAYRISHPLPLDAENPANLGALNMGGRWWRSPLADRGTFRWVMQKASRAHWNGHPRFPDYVRGLCLVWAAGNAQRAAWGHGRVLQAAETWSHSKRDFGRSAGHASGRATAIRTWKREKLARRFKMRGKTRAETADLMGVTPRSVSRYLAGREHVARKAERITRHRAARIAAARRKWRASRGLFEGGQKRSSQPLYISTKDREGYVTRFKIRTRDGATKTVSTPAPLRPEVEADRIAERRRQAAYLRSLEDP